MKKIIHIFRVILILTFSLNTPGVGASSIEYSQGQNSLVVVVNKQSTIESLSKNEVIDIYMGRFLTFPNGEPVRPLDFSPKSNYKISFYKGLVNRDEATVNAYWARLLFSGRATPPENVNSLENMLHNLSSSMNTLGYMPAHEVNDSVKVVYRFDET